MRLLIILLPFILTAKAYGFANAMFLKAGPTLSQAKVKALNGSNDKFFGTGFNTHFGYRFEQSEVSLSSYIFWGKTDNLDFRANGTTVTGNGSYRHVSFGPIYKYTSRRIQPFKGWHLYAALGPSWSLQTIKLDNMNVVNDSFNDNRKLTYTSAGGVFAIGIEENLPYKDMHPVYVEIVYSYKRSRQVSVVDTSKTTETNILTTEEARQEVNSHMVLISMGLTIF